MNYDEILPRLLVGSCPQSADDVAFLKQQEAVTALLCLQTDSDWAWLGLEGDKLESWCRSIGLVFRRAPVRDLDSQQLRERLTDCVEALEQLLAAGHKVYLHCTAGVGRAPSVAIAWLIGCQGWSMQQACDWVTHRRRCSPDLDAVRWAFQHRPAP